MKIKVIDKQKIEKECGEYYMKTHVLSMLAKGVETINKQTQQWLINS